VCYSKKSNKGIHPDLQSRPCKLEDQCISIIIWDIVKNDKAHRRKHS